MNKEGLQRLFTLAFYILAVACLVTFLLYREQESWLFISLGIAAVVMRILYYIVRLIK